MHLNIDATPHGRGFLIYIDDEEYQLTLSSLRLLVVLVMNASTGNGWTYPDDYSKHEQYLTRAVYKLKQETDGKIEIENNERNLCYRIDLELNYFDKVTINAKNLAEINDYVISQILE